MNATIWYWVNTNEMRQSALLPDVFSVMVGTAIPGSNRDS
jgi:hypothetical protein